MSTAPEGTLQLTAKLVFAVTLNDGRLPTYPMGKGSSTKSVRLYLPVGDRPSSAVIGK